jgi:hypothetical protein
VDRITSAPIVKRSLYTMFGVPPTNLGAVNQLALPRYDQQERIDFDMGVMLLVQQNCLPLRVAPGCLFKAKAVQWQPLP